MTVAERTEFSFETFSREPPYREVTRKFVRRTLLPQSGLIVGEVACGTGLGTEAIQEILNRHNSTIIGVDNNPVSLGFAQKKVPGNERTKVQFIQADGRFLPLSENKFDVFYFLNAIHEIPGQENQQKILDGIARCLKPGGKLFINSAFTKEFITTRTELLKIGRWKQRAMEKLGKGRDKNAQGFEIRSTEDYCEMMIKAGLTVKKEDIRVTEVELPSDSIRAISRYDNFIDGFFVDMEKTNEIPHAQKSKALIDALDEMEQELREKTADPNTIFTMTRNWIEIEAQKPI